MKKKKHKGKLTMIKLSNGDRIVVKDSIAKIRFKLFISLSGIISVNQQVTHEGMSIDRPDVTVYEYSLVNKSHIIEIF